MNDGIVTNTVPELVAASAAVGTALQEVPFSSVESTVVTVVTAGVAWLIRWLLRKLANRKG
jgi:hypothetical protein